MDLFDRVGVREIVYGAVVGRRFGSVQGEAQTRRVIAEDGAGPEGFDWLFRWFDWLRRPDRRERVFGSRPVLAEGTTLDVRHGVVERRFVPRTFRLVNDGTPFKVQLETDGWVVSLMNACDVSQTAAEVYREAQRAESIPREFTEAEFADLVCFLAERGFLRKVDESLEGAS
jgi:hypothetical protein